MAFFFEILWVLSMLVRIVSSADDGRNVCNSALGMQDGRIENDQLSASSSSSGVYISSIDKSYHALPKYGRLNGRLAWCGYGPHRTYRPFSFFQIDFGEIVNVTGLAMQGLFDKGLSRYVETFELAFSFNGRNWSNYSSPNKIWSGNSDGNSTKRFLFSETTQTKYLRILPLKYKGSRICLRVEVYGCRLGEDAKSSTTLASNESPTTLPSNRQTSPITLATTSHRTPTMLTSHRTSTMPTSHRTSTMPTSHRTSTMPTSHRTSTMPTSHRTSTIQPSVTSSTPGLHGGQRDKTAIPFKNTSPAFTATRSSSHIKAKMHEISSKSFFESNALLLLGVCVSCGVLVVLAIVVFVILRSKTLRNNEVAHRNLELECRKELMKQAERFSRINENFV